MSPREVNTAQPATSWRRRARVVLPPLLLLGVVAGLLIVKFAGTSTETLLHADGRARDGEVARVAAAIDADLAVARVAVEDFEKAVTADAVDDRDEASLRRYLLAEAIARPSLVELALTTGERSRYEGDGSIVLEPAGRRESAVARDSQGVLRARPAPLFESAAPDDPTREGAFRAAANLNAKGKLLAGDLAWSELDAPAAGSWRRKTLTGRKAIFGRGDRFVGVLRASVVSDALEQLGDHATRDDHTLFVCDAAGRLLTRLDGRDQYSVVDAAGKPSGTGDLRAVPAVVPPRVAAALSWVASGGRGATRLEAEGDPALVIVRPLGERPWLVVSVASERELVAPLQSSRNRSLAFLGCALAALALAALLVGRR